MVYRERKRVDVALEPELYLRVKRAAVTEGRSINAQIGWLLGYALMDWESVADARAADLAAQIAASARRSAL